MEGKVYVKSSFCLPLTVLPGMNMGRYRNTALYNVL